MTICLRQFGPHGANVIMAAITLGLPFRSRLVASYVRFVHLCS